MTTTRFPALRFAMCFAKKTAGARPCLCLLLDLLRGRELVAVTSLLCVVAHSRRGALAVAGGFSSASKDAGADTTHQKLQVDHTSRTGATSVEVGVRAEEIPAFLTSSSGGRDEHLGANDQQNRGALLMRQEERTQDESRSRRSYLVDLPFLFISCMPSPASSRMSCDAFRFRQPRHELEPSCDQ